MDNSFYSEIGKIGALTNKENAIRKYYDNPVYCRYCGEIIKIKNNEPQQKQDKEYFVLLSVV